MELFGRDVMVSTLSRPKAAAWSFSDGETEIVVSTLSRPKAAANRMAAAYPYVCFNTQPPEGGCRLFAQARCSVAVSTLSRPKAAAANLYVSTSRALFQHSAARRRLRRLWVAVCCRAMFQHSAARRRLAFFNGAVKNANHCFNTQPPEGGWEK